MRPAWKIFSQPFSKMRLDLGQLNGAVVEYAPMTCRGMSFVMMVPFLQIFSLSIPLLAPASASWMACASAIRASELKFVFPNPMITSAMLILPLAGDPFSTSVMAICLARSECLLEYIQPLRPVGPRVHLVGSSVLITPPLVKSGT